MIRAIPCIFAVALLAGAALPAAAQTVIGGDRGPAVTVDQGVLDSLGPPPTLPDLLRGRAPEPRALTAQPHRRSALRRPAKKRTAKAKRKKPTVAAKKAAPVAPVAVAPESKAEANATMPAAPRDSVTEKPLAQPASPAPPKPPGPPAAETATAAPPAAPSTPRSPQPAATAPAAAPAATAPPERPTVTAPTPPPTAAPSPAAQAAMNVPPAVPPAPPMTAQPVTPAAAPAAIAAGSGPTRVLFAGSGTDLPDTAKSKLAQLAERLKADDHLRVELVAHASGTADQANEARRVSLQRALAVRSYLMEQGVAATRMDVRALGNRIDGRGDAGKPLDRVDVVMLDH